MAKTAYDDELTTEEEEILKAGIAPPAADEGDPPTPTDAPAAADPAADPAAVVDPAAVADPAAAPVPTDEDKELAAFLERHKGKSSEELAKLALQQSKRASRSEFQARNAASMVQNLADRAAAARARKDELAAAAEAKKTGFRDKLASDPDAATAELYDLRVDGEIAEADAELARVGYQQAAAFAVQHIPEFAQTWPEMHGIANEFGYTDDELDQISDGRQLVMLGLATYAARAIKSGLMDNRGRLTIPQAGTPAMDPRLAAPDALASVGGTRGVAGGSTLTNEQELARLYALPDAEFNKIPDEVINALLKQAHQQ